jgi:sialate O-acetylesterase
LRFFTVPRSTAPTVQEIGEGKWVLCDSVSLKSFSAVGFYFGKKISGDLQAPVGLINASWGGTPAEVWTPAGIVKQDTALANAAAKLRITEWWPAEPGLTYNAMIAPLTRYTLAGAIWYQGESNTDSPATYSTLFKSMIDAWRAAWKKEFPFYYVQIAPFQYGTDNQKGALLQEAQTESQGHPHVGMVVITDLVDNVEDIHPVNKKDVGIRLANLSLSKTYHKAGMVCKYPALKSFTREKNKMILDFTNAENGLVIRGKKATEVFIAGSSKVFYPADVVVKGSQLIVSGKQVPEPVAVRFGFTNTGMGNLFSREGLPVTPFRTDDWDVLTVIAPKN